MAKKRRGMVTSTNPLKKPVGLIRPKKVGRMILSVCSKLKDIYDQGRNFNWEKPDKCKQCGSTRVWGHGFVTAYFDGYSGCFYLKRYRCPDCCCVFLMKPEGYFDRFHASIDTINACLKSRLTTGRWPSYIGKSRQRHWLFALKQKAVAWFGMGKDLLDAFKAFVSMEMIPVSRGK